MNYCSKTEIISFPKCLGNIQTLKNLVLKLDIDKIELNEAMNLSIGLRKLVYLSSLSLILLNSNLSYESVLILLKGV
jgi:hypothetical protein